MSTHRTRVAALLVALGLTAGVAPVAAAVAAPGASAVAPGRTHEVTLITGDKVRATQSAEGGWTLAATSGQLAYQRFPLTRDGRTDEYLIPSGASKLIADGVLDQELFNITGLIRQGFDDARSPAVPLLVEYPEATARAAGLPGAKVRRELPGLNLAAVDAAKGGGFWSALTSDGPRALAGGPSRIWLNGRAQATLAESVPQVGAPQAWQAGFTGKGVTVAVLDSGADEAHPDLAGKVKHRKDFSGKGDTGDGNGHGTHVAATVAGSGAGQGGKFKGVAPDAELAVGKVLDDTGSGQLDGIMAGMLWAVREAGAKVVNMSLGAGPTDGTDPMSQTVNRLSQEYGALFVISAGNSGQPGTVGTPGAADLALTVGSLTKAGGRSGFSSQGPRVKDGAIKPEISAPGSDIVAARAKGTGLGRPVDERYTSLSGTSMAAPHVAGGAALLRQQHPDWTAAQLKAALIATAAPVDGQGPFAVGAGRMDLAKAVGATVLATPGVVNANLKWPATKPQTRVLTYTNPGTAPVTLDLRLDLADTAGGTPPAALAKLSTNKLTVPAGGKAEVTLTFTPRSGRPGTYSGVLTATGGGATARTLIGVQDERESYDITPRMLDADGKPAAAGRGTLVFLNQADGSRHDVEAGDSLRVPPGTYTVIGVVSTPKPNGSVHYLQYAHPGLEVKRNTELTVDSRRGKKIALEVDQPSVRGISQTSLLHFALPNGDKRWGYSVQVDTRFATVSAYSERGGKSPYLSYSTRALLEDPQLELAAEGAQRTEFLVQPFDGAQLPPQQGRVRGVFAGGGTKEELAALEVKGKLVVLALPNGTSYPEVHQRIGNVKAAGGSAVALYAAGSAALAAKATGDEPGALPAIEVHPAFGSAVAAHAKAGGEFSLTVRGTSKHRYELADSAAGSLPATLFRRFRTSDLAAVTTAYHGYSQAVPPIALAEAKDATGWSDSGLGSVAVPSAERVEHYSPGTWRLRTRTREYGSGVLTTELDLAAGRTYRLEWNRAVAGPGFAGRHTTALGAGHPFAWARGELLDVTVPWFADAAGHPRLTEYGDPGETGSLALFADGREVARHHNPSRGLFARGANREYRLEGEVSQQNPNWRTSTRITAKWTFPANVRDGAALPLLSVRYAPPVDLRNLAPAGREVRIPVSVPRQDGPAPVDSLAIDYSTDDGASWQPGKVERAGADWVLTVPNPAAGFVSLRAKAAGDGSSVEQTIVKAYEVG